MNLIFFMKVMIFMLIKQHLAPLPQFLLFLKKIKI